MRMPVVLMVLIAVVIGGSATNVFAYSLSTSQKIARTNGTVSDVQNAINDSAVVSGWTVTLPTGSFTWTAGVRIPDSKGITLDGGGATITRETLISILNNSSASARITNFNFSQLVGGGGFESNLAVRVGGSFNNAKFRIDHSSFAAAPTTSSAVIFIAIDDAWGLIDHCSFSAPDNSEQIHNNAYGAQVTTGWSNQIIPGSPNALYLEANSFQNNNLYSYQGTIYFWGNSAVQNYYGARMLFRHNTLKMSHVDVHGTPGAVGGRWWEIYENDFNVISNGNQSDFLGLRAGSGVVFNNRATIGSNAQGGAIKLQEEDGGPYPAAYQIGRGKNQILDPAYIWNNGSIPVNNTSSSLIHADRDYILSAKPGYTPFTYPYPLTSAGLPNPAGAPTGACTSTSCSGASPWNAADLTYETVNHCVNTCARPGDTVELPAGSAVWGNSLRVTKGITLSGMGMNATKITSSINDPYGVVLVSYEPSNPTADEQFELSGIDFDGAYKSSLVKISSNSSSIALTKIKVHHNRFSNANSRAISTDGLEFGVFYANEFKDNYIAISDIGSEMDGWHYPLMQGGSNYPFFEDNTFTQTIARGGFIVETGRGGRITFRHNTISGYGGAGSEVFDAHGVTGTYPADTSQVSSEYYDNTIILSTSSRLFNDRGGKAIFFNNTVSGASSYIGMTEYQAWSYCTAQSYPKPQQVSSTFFWNNVGTGSAILPNLYCPSSSLGCSSCNPEQYDSTFIQKDRDYWLPQSGREANRPEQCTDSTYYATTDTEVIYQCHPNNTWTRFYSSYSYPHPLRTGAGAPRPAPPGHLRTVAG